MSQTTIYHPENEIILHNLGCLENEMEPRVLQFNIQ